MKKESFFILTIILILLISWAGFTYATSRRGSEW